MKTFRLWLLWAGSLAGLGAGTAQAPQGNARWHIGVDLLRNANSVVHPGLHAEVLVKYSDPVRSERFSVTGAVGFSRMRVPKDTIYTNLVYYNSRGAYMKAGIELGSALADRHSVTFGIQAVAAQFRDGGEFYIPNTYFEEQNMPFQRLRQWSLGLEMQVNNHFPVSGRCWLNLQVRGALLARLTRGGNDRMSPFYTPGFGYTGNGIASGGIALQAFYRLSR